LDPFSILEHGYDPYCKICHSKAFGTKGVGFGNAVVAEYPPRSPSNPTSPKLQSLVSPTIPFGTLREERAGAYSPSNPDLVPLEPVPDHHAPIQAELKSPNEESDVKPPSLSSLQIIVKPRPKASNVPDVLQADRTSISRSPSSTLPSTGQLGLPFTPPPKPNTQALPLPARAASSSPYNLRPTPTFPRPGFGADGPQRCPACSQTVYHAEQVLAIGKKWHSP
jgi:hypothetical protein